MTSTISPFSISSLKEGLDEVITDPFISPYNLLIGRFGIYSFSKSLKKTRRGNIFFRLRRSDIYNSTWTNGPRVGGDVIVTEPLRDEAGNIVRDKDGRPLYRTLRGPASLMGAGGLLVMPRAEPERVPREVDNRLNRIERILEDLRSKPSEESNIVTVTEPIRDERGRLITGEDGKSIYKIVKGPANLVGGVSDFRDRLLEKLALEKVEEKVGEVVERAETVA